MTNTTPPTTRAAFRAGLRAAVYELLDSRFGTCPAEVDPADWADAMVQAAVLPLDLREIERLEIFGEHFYFDDADMCTGYFKAYPEDVEGRVP